MSKSQRQPRRPTSPSARATSDRAANRLNARLALVWGWVAVYLVLFYRSPLASAANLPEVFRRWRLWEAVAFADDIGSRWIEGCSWRSSGQRAEILTLAGVIFATAWIAGWLLLQLSGTSRILTRLERFVFAAGLGLNSASLVTLVLGLCGLLRRDVFALAAAAVLIAGSLVVSMRRGHAAAPAAPALELPARDDDALQLDRRWLWLAAPFVVAIVLGAMLPPIDFDVREYHLQAPKEFYLAGRVTFLPHNVYANMPLGTEMLALLGTVAAGDWWTGALIGKTLMALFAPLTGLALLAAGRRFVSPAAGIVAALAYVSIPWIALVSIQGLVEGAYAFYLFMALAGVLIWQQQSAIGEHCPRPLALAGFLAGGAVSCKYPALVFSVLPLTAWITGRSLARVWSSAVPRSRWPDVGKPIFVFSMFVALGCGPWFVKNAVLAGNPTYPLLASVFDGQTRSSERDQQWRHAHRPANFQASDLVKRAAAAALTSDWLSPLIVPLAVLALVGSCGRRLAGELACYWAFVFLAWWLLTHRIDRFWTPILSVAALLAGIGAVWTKHRAWRLTLIGLLVLGLFSNFITISTGALGDIRYLADLDRLRSDPTVITFWHAYLNRHADEVTGVLLVGDAQPFDLEVPTLYNTVFDDSIFEQLARGQSPEQVRAALRARNISHVLVDWSEIRRYRSPGNYGFTDFVQPQVFERLATAGVLKELPSVDGTVQMFRVEPGE